MSKLYKGNLEKAIVKFQGELSIDPDSEKAIHGYGRCLSEKVLNTKKRKNYYNLEPSREGMEKLKNYLTSQGNMCTNLL